MKKSLAGKNIVITGASSGIGKATAFSLANQGANLILAARRELLLEDVALECEKYGVRAFHFKTDVTNLDQVNDLFEFAIDKLGSIDIWINNAGVGAVGEFTKTPIEIHEQVIKTNLMGQIHGAYVVIPYFKDRNQGVLVNNISLGAFVPNPFAAAYTASKYGLRGFSEALKYELDEFKNIHICDIFPAFIDTPGFVHGANYSGKVLKPAPPIYDPFKVAESIVSVCLHPRSRVMVGSSWRAARLVHALTPKLFGHMMNKFMLAYFNGAQDAEITSGNLFRPIGIGSGIYGGWKAFHPLKNLISR